MAEAGITVAMPTFKEILSALKEITEPYELGIHLDIEAYILRRFEKNHPGDVERQKAEVIDHWQRNCGNKYSWKDLADAIERMGTHSNLVKILRDKHIEAIMSTKLEPKDTVDDVDATCMKQDQNNKCPTPTDLKKYVWKHVGEKWEELALALGLDEEELSKKLDEIREKRKGNSLLAAYDVLMLWHKNKKDVTWERLIEALDTVGLTDAVSSINDFLDPNKVAVSDDTVLDEHHLRDICSELAPVRASYYQLGVQLGLPAGGLDAIKTQNSYNLDQAFTDMILMWLRQLYDVDRHGRPTRKRLLAAVSSPSGGKNPALARRAAAKIPGSKHRRIVHSEYMDELTYTAVLRELSSEVSHEWEEIGPFLGLKEGQLSIIKKDNPTDCQRCFREMMKLWFKQQLDPPPSWSHIIWVLGVIGYKRLARDLDKKYVCSLCS